MWSKSMCIAKYDLEQLLSLAMDGQMTSYTQSLKRLTVKLYKQKSGSLASFPGLPTIQLFDRSMYCKRSKNLTVGRLGNEGTDS